MVKSGVFLHIYYNSSFATCRQKHKMTNKQIRKVNYILQDNLLGLEAKILLLKLFIAKVREKVLRNTIGKIMKCFWLWQTLSLYEKASK